jgi:uncharacterized protein (UPF0147 family)
MITPKDFRQTNQLLARLIHDPDTPERMRDAAKKARRALFRYRDASSKRTPAHKCAVD